MNSLEQELRKHAGKSKLPGWLAERVRSKLRRLKQLYDIDYDPTVRSLIDSPSMYLQSEDIPALVKFFRRPIDIWLSECGTADFIFSKKDNDWIRAARKDFQIGIENPLTKRVESWARLDSETKRRVDHCAGSRRKDKSRFNGKQSYILPLEFEAYNKGVGVLESDTKMKIYLGFKSPIGTSPKGVDQSYICLECERIPRRQQTRAKEPSKVHGYKVRIHGYPVGPKDIEDDFRGLCLKVEDVPVVNTPV